MELYRDRKKDLHMLFIDLEKAYGRMSHEMFRRCLEKKELLLAYIEVIKDMYGGAKTSVKTLRGNTYEFSIKIGLHPYHL